MRNKPVIAVDFDGTVFDFHGLFVEFHNFTYGTQISREMLIDHAEFPGLFGCAKEVMEERMYQFDRGHNYSNYAPIAGAVEVIQELADHFEFHIVTARQEEHGRPKVAPYVAEFFGPQTFSLLHFAGSYVTDPTSKQRPRTKGEVCTEIGACLLIEDSPEHACAAADWGVQVLLIDQPWNSRFAHPEVTRVKTWQDVRRLILSAHF